MALNFAGATTFTAGGVAIASIDAGGNFSIPNKPVCIATQSGTGTAVGSDIIFNVTAFNVGNGYNTTNGRFTAPVAGVYHVFWRQLAQHTAASGSYIAGIFINGNYWTKSWTSKQAVNTWNSNSYRTYIYLNVGDYCTLRFTDGYGTTHPDGGYAVFTIQLVG